MGGFLLGGGISSQMGTICPAVVENVLISEIEMELSFRGCCGMRRRTRPHREGSPLNICAVPLSASSVAARMELELGRMENRVYRSDRDEGTWSGNRRLQALWPAKTRSDLSHWKGLLVRDDSVFTKSCQAPQASRF